MSFNWFRDCFLKVFPNEPGLIVTDQDPAMKEAIRVKFKSAKHRFCMWHISQKLVDKVDYVLYSNKAFQKQMNFIFWNQEMTPEKFEICWKSVVDDFGLHDMRWFKDLYEMKEMWVPCYFMDLPMNGLMRTSSLSESENAFFKRCKNKQSTLVDFFSRFDAAMEKQRHNNRLLEYEMENKSVNCLTPKKIEVHARDVYTPTLFLLVQEEIQRSSLSCAQTSCVIEGDKQLCIVQEKFAPPRPKWNYKVVFDPISGESNCSCLLFEREGRLCRHIYCVYDINDIYSIPNKYILRRWTKEASETFNLLSLDFDPVGESFKLSKDVFNKLRKVVSNLKNDRERLLAFSGKFDLFLQEFSDSKPDEQSSSSRVEKIQQVYGFSKPTEVLIHPPKNVRNKGQRTSKRYTSARENAVNKQVKRRECQYCFVSGHNIRSCKVRIQDELKQSEDNEDDDDQFEDDEDVDEEDLDNEVSDEEDSDEF